MKKRRKENYHGRPDWLTRAVVDASIELGKRDGTKKAAVFLKLQRVPLPIAVRVLSTKRARKPS